MYSDLILLPHQNDENNRLYASRTLRTNIMTLRLHPGQALNESELAEVLHMSRTPVHEAIGSLREEWLVDIFPQRGTQVTRIDPSLVKEGYNTRLLLEGDLLREQAGKFNKEQIQQLMQNLHLQEAYAAAPTDDGSGFIPLDDDFHRMIYYFSGRSHTWMAIRGLISHYNRMRYLDAREGEVNYGRVVAQHRELCDYLFMGLPAGVDPLKKTAAHMTSFRGNLIDTIVRYPDYFTI